MAQKFSNTFKHGSIRLQKRVDNGVWYSYFKNPNTLTWQQKSTGTTEKREAIKVADILSSRIVNKKLGIADGSTTIERLFKIYLKAKEPVIKPKSLKRFQNSTNNCTRFLTSEFPKVTLIKQFTPQHARDFMIWRIEHDKVTPRTVNNDITTLQGVFLWGIREKLIEESPFNYSRESGRIQLYKAPTPKREVYTKAEYEALVKAAKAKGKDLLADLIIVLANTGMRFEEAAHLKANVITWKADVPYVTIRASSYFTPKDELEIKHVPLTKDVQAVLKKRSKLVNGGFLFGTLNGRPIANNKARERLQKLFPDVGIDGNRKLHLHSFRNYFVVKCLDAGVLPHKIMVWTGHNSEALVLHYAQVRSADPMELEEFKKILA